MIIPDYIQKAIDLTLSEHPEYQDPILSIGKCIEASDNLIDNVEIVTDEVIGGFMDGNENHHWAVINNLYCVDLTARQFNVSNECPKIWFYIKPNKK